MNKSKGAGKLVAPAVVQLAVKVKLSMTAKTDAILMKTHGLFRDACNCLVPFVCDNPEKENWNRYNLHHAAYYEVRAMVPELNAQYVCNAIRRVSAAYKAKFAKHPRKKNEPIQKIVFEKLSIHLDARTLTYNKELTGASITTCEGRQNVDFVLADYQKKMLASGKIKESELVRCHNKHEDFWSLNIVIEIPTNLAAVDKTITDKDVLGSDIGENVIAAVSSGKIWKAGKFKDDRDRYMALRARLQSNGSESAKQHLRKASGRESRHVTHVNHIVSKGIVEEAKKQGAKAIVLENLTDIRERIKAQLRVRARLHRWPFRELQEMIEYKALRAGICVIYVDPRYTSQTCCACQQIGKRQKHRFVCPHCGIRAHSDLNASRNLQGLGRQLIAQGLL